MTETLEFDDRDYLAQSVLERVRSRDKVVIGIDGATGAGKTCLAKSFREDLGVPLLCMDDYVAKKRGAYVGCLRGKELRCAVDEALEKTGMVIVEGVCLLEILERIEVTVCVHVYVKRISAVGLWCDFDICDQELSRDKPNVENEVACYHRRFLPHEQADFVYRRVESGACA